MELRAQIAGLFRPRNDIYEDAVEGRRFHVVYFGMLVFACLISLFGLLLNSPAVIIGAMLISPLMGPLLASGLALATAEWSLGIKAARNVLFSVVETVSIAALATYLSPLREITPEIAARTNPNLIDLLIALFSGLAGTLAFSSRKGAMTILPGVAIATALMPPLATIGYGASTGRWDIARGAFMLFLTNFTAIIFSAAIGFFFVGFRPGHRAEMHRLLVRWRIGIALVILCALAIPLMQTLIKAVRQQHIRNRVEEVLANEFNNGQERRLSSVALEFRPAEVSVSASVQTVSYIDSADVTATESALSKAIGRPVRLDIQQLQLVRQPQEQVNVQDFVSGGAIKQVASQEPANPAQTIAAVRQDVQTYLTLVLGAAGVTNVDVDGFGTSDSGALVIRLVAEESKKSDQSTCNAVATGLAEKVNSAVEMTAFLISGEKSVSMVLADGQARPSPSDVGAVRRATAQWRSDGYDQCSILVGPNVSDDQIASLIQAANCERVQHRGTTIGGAAADEVTLRPARELVCQSLRVDAESGQTRRSTGGVSQPDQGKPR